MTGVHVGYWEIVVEVIGRTASQVKIVRNTVTHPNKKKIKIKKCVEILKGVALFLYIGFFCHAI